VKRLIFTRRLKTKTKSTRLAKTQKSTPGAKKKVVTVRHKKNWIGAKKESYGEKLEEKREDWRK
jgi:hypothetical protein